MQSTTLTRLSKEELDFISEYESSGHDCHFNEEDGCDICEQYDLMISRLTDEDRDVLNQRLAAAITNSKEYGSR